MAVTLWILLTYVLDSFFVAPMLALLSPVPRCGKTTLMTALKAMVRRPLASSNITAAGIFRVIETYSPTLLIDEADSFIELKDEIRGILNAGHTRSTATVIRIGGDPPVPMMFNVFGAKAIAAIGSLPATIIDRSIIVPIRRRGPQEVVERFRLHQIRDIEPIAGEAMRWGLDNRDALLRAEPDVPELNSDRAADNWGPLLAIADILGGGWPAMARQAAITLTRTEADEADGVTLLGQIREIFKTKNVTRLPSKDLVSELTSREDWGWAEFARGKGLNPTHLARLLKPFGVKPRTIKYGGNISAKGYALEWFTDAFTRYLPPVTTEPATAADNDADGAGEDN